MKALVLTRGAPGCGKSTWLKENGLLPFVISSDTIRLMHHSPIITQEGRLTISQEFDNKVWKMLTDLVTFRMMNGCFTIVDACHSKPSDLSKYDGAVKFYGYKAYCLDFTDVPLEVVKERNRSRLLKIDESFRYVPDTVIDVFYERIKMPPPLGIEVIKPENFWDLFIDFRNLLL